jgi:hypothetical protein
VSQKSPTRQGGGTPQHFAPTNLLHQGIGCRILTPFDSRLPCVRVSQYTAVSTIS